MFYMATTTTHACPGILNFTILVDLTLHGHQYYKKGCTF